jgi:hypothetical protein
MTTHLGPRLRLGLHCREALPLVFSDIIAWDARRSLVAVRSQAEPGNDDYWLRMNSLVLISAQMMFS